MPKDETGDAAFTLTEVIIAMVLMLLALGLLLSAFVSSKRSVTLAQTHLTAMQIARSEADQLPTTYASIVPTNATLTNACIQYTMSRLVTNILDNYKEITIIVNWTNSASSRRQALTNYMIICNQD
ncbi:MAG: hypothetical protein Q7J98_09580 [Kiritimatiellia bacterium]|nr:hypothetical protein [Kiritimatiellia bacterium]